LAGAVMFAALHQGLLTVLGARTGRIASLVLMVLQAVTLVGILPVDTAPGLLQSLSSLMPLPMVTQGLVHAAVGGRLATTGSTLLAILAWAAVSLLLTLVASRRARLADRSEHVGARPVPAMAGGSGSPEVPGPARRGQVQGRDVVGDQVHRTGVVLHDAAQHDRAGRA